MHTEKNTQERVIYLAGGCFWGIEHLMRAIPGVLDAKSGYANGRREADANYEAVCAGGTGFRETVRVIYDPTQVSLEALLLAYFYVIDPTEVNRQGMDLGSQYQTGVYYADDAARETVERIARRPVPVRLINATTIAAMGLFLVLFAVLVVQDFNNFIL